MARPDFSPSPVLGLLLAVVLGATPAVASTLLQNRMKVEFSPGSSGIEIYRYRSGATETFDDTSFDQGELVNTAVVADKLALDPARPDMTNLALGRPARQSSTRFGREAGMALDGNAFQRWVWNIPTIPHTGNDLNAWWQVDLGAVTDVGHVEIYNRSDCCWTRLDNVWVFVSDTNLGNVNLAANLADPDVTAQFIGGAFGHSRSIAMNATGRYVTVQLAGRNPLHMPEVKVFRGATSATQFEEYGYTNVAPAGIATQSSQLRAGSGPEKAIDESLAGNHNANEIASTVRQNNPWWQVDLGASTYIEYIDLHSRSDWVVSRFAQFSVFVSDTDMTGMTLAAIQADPTVTAFDYTDTPGYLQTVVDVGGVVGRYVRIQQRRNETLELAEVRVFSRCGSWTSPEFPVNGPMGLVGVEWLGTVRSDVQISFDGGPFVGPDGTEDSSYQDGDFVDYALDGSTTARIRVAFCGDPADVSLCTVSLNHTLQEVAGVDGPPEAVDTDGWTFRVYPADTQTRVRFVDEVGSDTYTLKDDNGLIHITANAGAITDPSPPFVSEPFSLGLFDVSVPQAAMLDFQVASDDSVQLVSPVSMSIDR